MRTAHYIWRYLNSVVGRETMKPEFFLIGAQKSGTTSLFKYIAQHPCVVSPLGKEIHYFDQAYRKGRHWYQAWFPFQAKSTDPSCERVMTGEGSTNYLFDYHTPKRIRRYAPDAKLIAILRNPVDRAFSHYQHENRKGRESRKFGTVIKDELSWMDEESNKIASNPKYWSKRHYRHSYLQRGYYAEQLKRWFAEFPRNQFLIFNADQFFSDPQSVYESSIEFLGLKEFPLGEFKRHNAGKYTAPIPEEMRAFMLEYFKPKNDELYELLGVNFGW